MAALLAVLLSAAGNAREAGFYLQSRWYQLEVIVFERGDWDETVRRQKTPVAMPRNVIGLANLVADAALAPAGADDAAFSDRSPPLSLVGECVARHWWPPNGWADRATLPPADPCMPKPADLVTAYNAPALEDSADADQGDAAEPPIGPAVRQQALEELTDAFAEFERTLEVTSYEWRPEVAELRTALRRLGPRYNVIAAGTWHQALPPREQPQPLLVQLADPTGQPALEGWVAATVGRYIHFRVHLRVPLSDTEYALVSESRRLRSGEVHYLDHPMVSLLVQASPVAIPEALVDQVAALEAL